MQSQGRSPPSACMVATSSRRIGGHGGTVELRLLGTTEVLRDDVAASLGGPLQRAVLADLALCAPLTVSIEQLVDELWEPSHPASATHTVRVYVSRLRRSLARIGCPGTLIT